VAVAGRFSQSNKSASQDTVSYFQMVFTSKLEHGCQPHDTGRFKISCSRKV